MKHELRPTQMIRSELVLDHVELIQKQLMTLKEM